jgi:hypothetical protein
MSSSGMMTDVAGRSPPVVLAAVVAIVQVRRGVSGGGGSAVQSGLLMPTSAVLYVSDARAMWALRLMVDWESVRALPNEVRREEAVRAAKLGAW